MVYVLRTYARITFTMLHSSNAHRLHCFLRIWSMFYVHMPESRSQCYILQMHTGYISFHCTALIVTANYHRQEESHDTPYTVMLCPHQADTWLLISTSGSIQQPKYYMHAKDLSSKKKKNNQIQIGLLAKQKQTNNKKQQN